MDSRILFGVQLIAAFICFCSCSLEKCHLSGKWENQHKSILTITNVKESTGTLMGNYVTIVSVKGNGTTANPESALYGVQDRGEQPTFAFTVDWSFAESKTAWVGQCFVDNKGRETLETVWVLRSKVDKQSDNWKATRVGMDTFKRVRNRPVDFTARVSAEDGTL
ncbi:avidin-like [Protopterus annectens]|uniref:avidin-like n=1 Tax=Protopterus annectens TaxID=7888 RepID=UPI001CF9C83A|nr:avidin-like [Protopterus annectens]